MLTLSLRGLSPRRPPGVQWNTTAVTTMAKLYDAYVIHLDCGNITATSERVSATSHWHGDNTYKL